jgi:hypothetical protein
MLGISSNRYCTSDAACLRQAGYDFVIRYYSRTTHQPEKVILIDEAKALSAAGLQLAVVYEDNADHAGYFNGAEGKKDGYYAYYYAQKLHQPGGSAIYFAVDYDADAGEISGRIQDYFQGVYQGFKDFSGGSPVYDVGVYGSGAVCNWLKTHLPFVKYGWLAESTGWLGSGSYNEWDVKQFVTNAKLCGLPPKGWEKCEAKDNFGQFKITAP